MSDKNPSFVPFIGLVEDINDPLKLGRVRVRVINHHDEDIDTGDLDWCNVVQPTTSTALQGAGQSPTWLGVGTTVIGFYLDGEERSIPMVIGSMPTIPNNDKNKHGVNALARGEKGTAKVPLGPEPKDAAAPEYPYNKTISTAAGHLIELDDTPGKERVHIRHMSGAYVEINTSGQIVIRSFDDRYDIVDGKQETYVTGDQKSTTKGKLEMIVEGSMKVTSKGTLDIKSDGTVNIKGSKINLN